MNTHEFIQIRNSEMKAIYQVLRSDKSLNVKKRLEKIAKQFGVSSATVHDAVYRSNTNSKKTNA